MKIFLCGQKHFGRSVFDLLLNLGHEVIGVCAPIEQDGRIDRLYTAAKNADIHILPAGHLRSETLPTGVDLIIAAHSYDYIGLKTLSQAKLGGIGYHPSLLPLHRGRSAIEWAIRMNNRVTGGTIYWLSKNVDGGAIAAQDYCLIPPGWDAARLWRDSLQPIGLRLFAQVLADLDAGRIVAIPQDESCATWEPALDAPPIFRPDLPQIGAIAGYEVIATKNGGGHAPAAECWRSIAGG